MKFYDYAFEYERVVIGSSLKALLYSYCNDLPILFPTIQKPCYFEFINPEVDLAKFGIQNESFTLPTADKEKKFGHFQRDLWRDLAGMIGLRGNMPMLDKTLALRLEDEKSLKATTNNSRFARFKFEELIVFDDNISGLDCELIKPAPDLFRVVDWIEIKSGKSQKINYFQTNDDLVREIFLYPSDKVDGLNQDNLDAASISYLNREQLSQFEYSDTYAKFKVFKIFKEAGFKGTSNGWSKENPLLKKYYALKIETTKREVRQEGRSIYKDTDNIKFNYQALEELLSMEIIPNNETDRLRAFFIKE